MNKYLNTPNKQRWLFIIALLLNTLNLSPVQAQGPERNRWLNWIDYVSYHPDYRQYQEPQDITTKGAQWGTWVTFPNKIAAIATKVRNWDDPTSLFKSLDFVAIYKHPGHYYDHCLEYLANPQQPEEHKKIVIYAMEQHGYRLARACYELYQKRQLSENLFRVALGDFDLLRIHSLVTQNRHGDFDKKNLTAFLQKVQSEVGTQTPIGIHIESIISGQLAKKWVRKGPSPLLHYRDKLPVAPTIKHATKEYGQYVKGMQWTETWEKLSEVELAQARGGQQYLMLLEHINEYMFLGSNDGDDDFFSLLKNPHTTNEEK